MQKNFFTLLLSHYNICFKFYYLKQCFSWHFKIISDESFVVSNSAPLNNRPVPELTGLHQPVWVPHKLIREDDAVPWVRQVAVQAAIPVGDGHVVSMCL